MTEAKKAVRESVLKHSQPISEEEMDRRFEVAFGGTFIHSYPDDGDDLLLEPPPFDDDGNPIDTSGN